jgi:DHA1 family multidrug resistance protein-like MFS transporter
VYVGSSIYTSSQEDVVEIFGVSHVEGALGIALYVLVSIEFPLASNDPDNV